MYYVHGNPGVPARARASEARPSTSTGAHRHTRGCWRGAGVPNPAQSLAPPWGPTAQGATSDQASRRLQIRSALSPPAGSGDPPPVPSAPARLRTAALLLQRSRDRPATALGLSPRPPQGGFPPCSPASRASVGPQKPKMKEAGAGAVRCGPMRRPEQRARVPGPVGVRPRKLPDRPLGLTDLLLPGAEAHFAQPLVALSLPGAAHGPLEGRVPPPPKVA